MQTPLLGLGYLFWGVTFIISLVIPFSVSISAILIFYNLWTKTKLQIKQKFVATIFIIITATTIIIMMDDITRDVAKQPVLQNFVYKVGLNERLTR